MKKGKQKLLNEVNKSNIYENIFCSLSNLRNESDVEQFFVIRLLNSLGYEDNNIHTKETVSVKKIGKGKDQKDYRPDYLIYVGQYPVISIDVKHPCNAPDEGLKDALLYAREINGEYTGKNPIRFCIGINGLSLILCKWDENTPFLSLAFNDFQSDNEKFNEFIKLLSYKKLIESIEKGKDIDYNGIKLIKPDLGEIKGIFRTCHNKIWNNESCSPSFAFYEFVKLMFIKLNEDKKIHFNKELIPKIENGLPIPDDKVVFSLNWIKKQEEYSTNPVDSILFKNLTENLEKEIEERKKKRIFDKNEHIKLKPSSIKDVVELLENLDLYGIDEDINGRIFEAFLSATMRGEELGQFFTPRNVVEFMTKMADIRVDKQHIDKILDGCCGTGGFLIDAMAEMSARIGENDSLTNIEREEKLELIKNDCIYGIDIAKDPPLARIARINMYLHKDGGSRIYQLDALDKEIDVDEILEKELKRDVLEFKNKLRNEDLKFDIILTNPPFAKKYSIKHIKKTKNEFESEETQERILKQYWIAKKQPDSMEFRPSLKSSVMFLERYYELLKPHGKLLIILDEGVLNTLTNKSFRDFIKNKFNIKAVIALPQNTFVNADSGVKTSILYLVKKKIPDEIQSKVFMAISENVGHSDSGKPTPDKCDLNLILSEFRKFEQKGGA